MGKNSNLRTAARVKNDEFYTQISDIENELKHYKSQFKGKAVFCNCDDPEESNFWRYFSDNFEHLGLKRLVATHFKDDEKTYKLEISKDINGDGKVNKNDMERTILKGNGDFRNEESIKILKDCDIVVTNPPFSLFKEYIDQLQKHNKKFIVVGNFNAVSYRNIFKYMKEDRMWLGEGSLKEFRTPEGEIKKFGNINWFTNLAVKKRSEEIILYKKYYGNEENYPKYDHYDAININKVKDIPMDYYENMGVPISYFSKYNPEQFEIIDGLGTYSFLHGATKETKGKALTKVNGKKTYARLIIRRK